MLTKKARLQEQEQVIPEKETVDLSFMLLQMADEFYPLLAAHGNEIQVSAESGMSVYGDPDKLAQVFQNLLENAIAYSYENTEIEVEAQKTEAMIKISFRNRGKTIPRQKLDVLFEKFFRLDSARMTPEARGWDWRSPKILSRCTAAGYGRTVKMK